MWLSLDVASVVPAGLQDSVRAVSVQVSSMYPSKLLPGFKNNYNVSMLYRLQPPQWFNDAVILAMCERLDETYPFARLVGQSVPPGIVARIVTSAGDESAKTLLLPINFGNHHWCGIIIDIPSLTVRYYDSLNSRNYQTTLSDLAWSIVRQALPGYTVVALNSPIQFDGFSCGFFVCMQFWRHIGKTVSTDMSTTGLTNRRYEFLHYVLTGQKAE